MFSRAIGYHKREAVREECMKVKQTLEKVLTAINMLNMKIEFLQKEREFLYQQNQDLHDRLMSRTLEELQTYKSGTLSESQQYEELAVNEDDCNAGEVMNIET